MTVHKEACHGESKTQGKGKQGENKEDKDRRQIRETCTSRVGRVTAEGAKAVAFHLQPSSRGRFRPGPALLRQVRRPRYRDGTRWHGAGARHPFYSSVPPGRSLQAALSRRRFPDGLCAQCVDQDRVRWPSHAYL